MTLIEFLTARLDEDEAVARDALEPDAFGEKRSYYSGAGPHRDDWGLWTLNILPARVLAEVETKRRIMELVGWLDNYDIPPALSDQPSRLVLRLLAHLYADHRDYDEAWRP